MFGNAPFHPPSTDHRPEIASRFHFEFPRFETASDCVRFFTFLYVRGSIERRRIRSHRHAPFSPLRDDSIGHERYRDGLTRKERGG